MTDTPNTPEASAAQNVQDTAARAAEAFGALVETMALLRAPGGCPWDAEQTHASLIRYLVEEAYEVVEAVETGGEPNMPLLREELGDVLLHVCFYAKIASETGDFDIADVCDKLTDKLIFRHPHVYGEAQADTAGQVSQNWEQIKLKEKDGNKSVLGGVPEALPSLIKAYRIQDKARNVGFDWEKKEDVWDKVREELGELQAELAREDKEKSTDEFGDFLFSVINAGRLYHINPDNALERTNRKFIRRFNYVEQHSIRQGRSLKDMTLGEMDALWNEAKEMEKRGGL